MRRNIKDQVVILNWLGGSYETANDSTKPYMHM